MLRGLLLICFVLLSFIGDAQLDTKIKEVIDQEQSQHAAFGISVKDPQGATLYEYQGKTRLIPASTFKLITTLSAVEILGEDFKYETEIGYTGELLNDGTLVGDLVIVGSGDPSLGSPEYDKIQPLEELLSRVVATVMDAGIKCIDGRILVDPGVFDDSGVHPSWAWDDLTNYYASGAYGFNIHENYYFLDFGRSGQPERETTIVDIRPHVPGLVMTNEVRTGPLGSGDNAYIYGHPYDRDRSVEGTIPPGDGVFTIKGALPSPALFGAHHIYEALASAGIRAASFGVAKDSPTRVTTLAIFPSQDLADMAAYANEISNNLYCEAFFKTVGALLDAGQGSYESGRKAVLDHLAGMGLDTEGIHIEDGSGLSARNRISPDFMTSFLVKKGAALGEDALRTYIPKVGAEGSVRNFLNGYEAQGHAWLKSGSINNVLAYAGLLESKSDKVLMISIMANGHHSNRSLRGQMEKIIEIIYQGV